MPRATLDALQDLAVSTIGLRITFVFGYGRTETAPGIATTPWPTEESGEIGLPEHVLRLAGLSRAGKQLVQGTTGTPKRLGLTRHRLCLSQFASGLPRTLRHEVDDEE